MLYRGESFIPIEAVINPIFPLKWSRPQGGVNIKEME
jgi:hypothetical protein